MYMSNFGDSPAHDFPAQHCLGEAPHLNAQQEPACEHPSQIEKPSAKKFVCGIAHDFNNTLAEIRGRAELMLRTNDPEKIKRGLNIIISASEHGVQTVDRLQDFARQHLD